MEALAEQPAGMRRRAVIMGGKEPAGLALGPENAEIAALRGIAAERGAFVPRLRGGRLDRDLAAALGEEAVRPDPAPGEVVGGEFPDRQPAGEACGKRIGGVVVLVAALEGWDPQRIDGASRDHAIELGRRPIEIGSQPARRHITKHGRPEPNDGRREPGLLATAPYPRSVGPALPGPQRRALRHTRRQINHKHPRARRPGAQRSDAARRDLVIGMRRQDQDAAGRHQARAPAASRHTGSRSSVRISVQFGTRAST
jgi:hypothetical protein